MDPEDNEIPSSSGVYDSSISEEEGEDRKTGGNIFFSPQSYQLPVKVSQSSAFGRIGRPIKQIDTLMIPISDDIDYSSIQFPVACDVCSNVYANGNVLLAHMKQDHADFQPLQCKICTKTFSKSSQLQKHCLSHQIDKNYVCPTCNQKFSRQDCLKVHMRIHDKSKCVQCDVCEKSFLTQGALNIHQRIHRGEKPFKCHLCGKCFTQKNHVIMHILRHSRVGNPDIMKKVNPRLFQCQNCPRTFIRLSDFERHMQWTHGMVSTDMIAGPQVIRATTEHEDRQKHRSIKAFYERLNAKDSKEKKKSVCTIATQTDDQVDRVIIPSKYQNLGSTTPRPDEHMYDTEMFDEGMDRNYSSDEDEVLTTGEPFVEMTNFGTSMSAVDEAFDAVLGKVSTGNSSTCITTDSVSSPAGKEEMTDEENLLKEKSVTKKSKSNDSDTTKMYNKPITNLILENQPTTEIKKIVGENVNIEKEASSTKETDIVIKKENSKYIPQQNISKINKCFRNNAHIRQDDQAEIDAERMSPVSELPDNDITLINIYNRNAEDQLIQLNRNVKIKSSFDMSNWQKPVLKARSRGRGKNKVIMGLKGASHLRLMRKSLLHFIAERNDDHTNEEYEDDGEEAIEGQFDDMETKNEIVGKRQAKTKQHSKDFTCSSKMCEMCQPSISKTTIPKQKTTVKIAKKFKKELPIRDCQDKSKKLLQFILSGDTSTLEGTDFKLLSEAEGEEGELYRGPSPELSEPEYEPVAEEESSAELNYKTVFIPTFSCKLCGREFRFEGKLHRHIEAVHQKKVIFSPDIRPGIKRIKLEDSNNYYTDTAKQKDTSTVNPELAALRSDWDDEEDQNESKSKLDEVPLPKVSRAVPVKRPIYGMSRPHMYSTTTSNLANKRFQKDFGNYSQVVKVNFNKLVGNMVENKVPVKIENENAKPKMTKNVSLETKCSKLLEKLFKMGLLLKCGHNVDHVSTVLGRVLQHYGVKMIEDYGQGQYEVLKYNLWRLIEWKVTMEQMEEFYTQGKSVEEMMDDIMNHRVPITAHLEPEDKLAAENALAAAARTTAISTIETMPINDQLMISQVGLDGNVTQLMLAQDVSPEMLQGAHIVTLDPNTGQVVSQVTAEHVILAGSVSEELTRHIESIDNSIVVSNNSAPTTTIVSTLPPGSIVSQDGTIHISSTTIEGELIEIDEDESAEINK